MTTVGNATNNNTIMIIIIIIIIIITIIIIIIIILTAFVVAVGRAAMAGPRGWGSPVLEVLLKSWLVCLILLYVVFRV